LVFGFRAGTLLKTESRSCVTGPLIEIRFLSQASKNPLEVRRNDILSCSLDTASDIFNRY